MVTPSSPRESVDSRARRLASVAAPPKDSQGNDRLRESEREDEVESTQQTPDTFLVGFGVGSAIAWGIVALVAVSQFRPISDALVFAVPFTLLFHVIGRAVVYVVELLERMIDWLWGTFDTPFDIDKRVILSCVWPMAFFVIPMQVIAIILGAAFRSAWRT